MPLTQQERRSMQECKIKERGRELDRERKHWILHFWCIVWLYLGYWPDLDTFLYVGPVTVVNLRDITTQSDLMNENAVFVFNTHPSISSTAALGYRVQIQWNCGLEFGSNNGTHTVYLPPEGPRNCRGTSNTTLELVGTGSYKLTVPTAVFDSGPLSISVSVSLVCLPRRYASYICNTCLQWRYAGRASNSIDISAKRGRATHAAACICWHGIIYSTVVYR